MLFPSSAVPVCANTTATDCNKSLSSSCYGTRIKGHFYPAAGVLLPMKRRTTPTRSLKAAGGADRAQAKRVQGDKKLPARFLPASFKYISYQIATLP
jgi:hypothetical protein